MDAGRGDARAAGERIERGIQRYGSGDFDGAARELEEALKLCPGHPRAQALLKWLRERPADPATDSAAPGAAAPPASEPWSEGSWRPRPLTPGGQSRSGESSPPVAPTPGSSPAGPALTSSPPTSGWSSFAVPVAASGGADNPSPGAAKKGKSGESRRPQSTDRGTLLGLQSPGEPGLMPTAAAPPAQSGDGLGSAASGQNWTPEATSPNLLPLDVPELTDQQISVLAGGDTAPSLEIEAELPPEIVTVRRRAQAPTARVPRQSGETNPSREFTAETTPDFREVPASLLPASAVHSDMHASLSPLEVPPDPTDIDDGGTHPTNPFIRSAPPLAATAATEAGGEARAKGTPPPERSRTRTTAKVVPPRSSSELRSTRMGFGSSDRRPALPEGPLKEALAALERGETEEAFDLSEHMLAAAGGASPALFEAHQGGLEVIYQAIIGPFDRAPHHGPPIAPLDPRSAFLLSRLDGQLTAEDIVDVSGMSRMEALRCLAHLIRRGAVVFK